MMKCLSAAGLLLQFAAAVDSGNSNDLGLGIRFEKFGAVTGDARVVSYPMTYGSARWLRQNTDAISTVHRADCINCKKHMGPQKLIDYLTNVVGVPLPSHPERDSNAPYWEHLRKVVQVQELRNNGGSVEKLFPLPEMWKGHSIEKVAMAVRNELPGRYHMALLEAFLADGVQWTDLTPRPLGKKDFLRRQVMLAGLNGAVINHVGPTNFQVKWALGRARPEEVAWKIHEGEITEEDGVPADLVERIQAMDLANAADFTAYKNEGSPNHPSWPAMHSAGSSGSLWMATVMNLTDKQLCEVRKLDYAIAFARTVAGVHYEDDNIAGLALGYKVVGDFLVRYLHEHYGASKKAVRERVRKLQAEVDWNTFLDSDCAKGNVD